MIPVDANALGSTSPVDPMTNSIEDFPDVLEAAIGGDNDAWARLYDSIAGQLLGYLRGHGATDPDGLLGDTFLQLARNLKTFKGTEAGFRSWAFGVAHHRLIDERRRSGRRPTEIELSERESETPHADLDVETEAIHAVERSGIERLLDELSEDQRDVVLLRILAGLSAADTANAIGKSPGTVRVIQHRALQKLKDQITSGDVTL